MYYIEVPEPVRMAAIDGSPILQEGNKEWFVTLAEFIQGRLTDKNLNSEMDRLFAVVDMREAVRELGDKKYLALETKHWEYLRDAVKTPHPETGYNHIIAHNLVPLIKAVVNATDKKPDDFDGEPVVEAVN